MSLIAEQSTRMISQILDDYELLEKEFLALNIAEVLEKRPDLATLTLFNLTNIRNISNITYTFLQGMKIALEEEF